MTISKTSMRQIPAVAPRYRVADGRCYGRTQGNTGRNLHAAPPGHARDTVPRRPTAGGPCPGRLAGPAGAGAGRLPAGWVARCHDAVGLRPDRPGGWASPSWWRPAPAPPATSRWRRSPGPIRTAPRSAPISMHDLLIDPLLFKRLPYDPSNDFAWISAMWDLPNVAVVPAQHVPARTIAEFAAWAKARPGGVSYGSSGVGTTIHLSGAVPGRPAPGSRRSMSTLPRRRADHHRDAVGRHPVRGRRTWPPMSASSRKAACGAWPSPCRSAGRRCPTCRPWRRPGWPISRVSPWHLWAAPRGTPRAIVDQLSAEIRAAWADPALQQRAIGMGARLTGSTPQGLAARLARERPIWAEMVKVSGRSGIAARARDPSRGPPLPRGGGQKPRPAPPAARCPAHSTDAQADPALLLAVLGLGACDDKQRQAARRRPPAPRPPRRAAPPRTSSAPGCA